MIKTQSLSEETLSNIYHDLHKGIEKNKDFIETFLTKVIFLS